MKIVNVPRTISCSVLSFFSFLFFFEGVGKRRVRGQEIGFIGLCGWYKRMSGVIMVVGKYEVVTNR